MQAGPKMAQDRPKTVQDGPKTAQDSSKTSQNGPRRLQDCPKTVPRWPQDGPKPTQDGPRRPRCPKQPQDGPSVRYFVSLFRFFVVRCHVQAPYSAAMLMDEASFQRSHTFPFLVDREHYHEIELNGGIFFIVRDALWWITSDAKLESCGKWQV
jgi:hypothetical protein